jgi:hypothetical protein
MPKTGKWKDFNVPSKWTTSKEKRKPKSSDNDNTSQVRRFFDWSAQEITRYNQLFTEIKIEREKDTYTEFEKYCIDEFQEEAEAQGLNKHKHKKIEPDKPLPSTKHELWDNDNHEEEHKPEVSIRLLVGLKGLVGI